MRRPVLWFVVLAAVAAIGGRVSEHRQAQTSGQLLCVGPASEQYLSLDWALSGRGDALLAGRECRDRGAALRTLPVLAIPFCTQARCEGVVGWDESRVSGPSG